MIRRIPLSTASNMRDLGGYPVDIVRIDQSERFMPSGQFSLSGQFPPTGQFTQYGRLFRSDCPSAFTMEDLAWIQKLGIRTAIDLRSDEECEQVPSAYKFVPGCHTIGVRSPLAPIIL